MTEQRVGSTGESRNELTEVTRYYELAKKAEWKVGDLPWEEQPPFPELPAGSRPRKVAIHQDIWRSVITQQLQADELAVQMSSQLLAAAPDPEAKLYYTTMVQDESRHTEAWLKLTEAAGGRGEHDHYLDELVRMVLEADTVEEKVFMMQVFYEKAVISRFKVIADSAGATVLKALCKKLMVDDGIHHRSGVAYEEVLLANTTVSTKHKVEKTARQALPFFVKHALWRPKAREKVSGAMEASDRQWVLKEVNDGKRLAGKLGLDLADVTVEFPKAA